MARKTVLVAKLLLIEDDALLSRMYQTIFVSSSYDVTLAEDGQQGLDLAREHHPDVILLDVMMPKLNGLEVLRQLKADAKLKDVPVIMLTNLAGNTDIQTALQLGAVRYIIKNENRPKEVEAIVREILEGYTRRNSPKAAKR
jgi:DNA-binding response OmpR family regulator